MALLVTLTVVALGVGLGWYLRALKADTDEDRAWWAARPHIDGIECPPEAQCAICMATEIRQVTLTMPAWMLGDLRRRARERGITVTELIRRAVALDKLVHDDPSETVTVRKTEEARSGE